MSKKSKNIKNVKVEKGFSEEVEMERAEFKSLIIKNPNYFGTFPGVKIKPVKPMKFNTKYEEIRCIGFYPELDLLEAVVDVKLPYGYKGDLCSAGSFEYVRFFVDWDGDGDFTDASEDVGIESVNVHDIPDGEKVCLDETKPLSYAVAIKISPKRLKCTSPNLVKVRAILSWEIPPPAGDPNFSPPWGNVIDRWIQIKPAHIFVKDIVEIADLDKLGLKQKMLKLDVPISKTETLTPAELKEIYKGKDVPEHRFNFSQVYQMAEKVKQDPSLIVQYKLDKNLVNIVEGIGAIIAGKPETKYEELHCVGLNYDLDRLVATLTVKLPYGYSGNLCTDGSYEFVAFWAYVWDQFEQTCYWKYLGTSSVNVHDIPDIPPEGLQYAVYLPVDLSSLRDKCNRPKIIKIRAILSWHSPPPVNNPNYNPVWGNKVDSLIQIKPRPRDLPEGVHIPFITFVGGMAVCKISGNSETVIPSVIGDGYANGANALESPFGGVISICGRIEPEISPSQPKLRYKVQYKKSTDTDWSDITNPFTIYLSTFDGVKFTQKPHLQTSVSGYYEYQEYGGTEIDGGDYCPGKVLADWHTHDSIGFVDDGLYEVRLLLYEHGAPGDVAKKVPPDHVASNVIKVMVDNTRPDPVKISLDFGPCEKFTPSSVITGTFTAEDKHIWRYRFSVAPYSPPAGQFTHVPAQEDYPLLSAPGVHSGTFALDTRNMVPCGYVIYIWVWDRAILNNYLIGNQAGNSVGFCLLKGE